MTAGRPVGTGFLQSPLSPSPLPSSRSWLVSAPGLTRSEVFVALTATNPRNTDDIHNVAHWITTRSASYRNGPMVSLEASKSTVTLEPPQVWTSLTGPLAEINERVLHLFAMVSEGLAAATAAFLDGDRDAARKVVAADQEIDALESAIEDLIQRRLVALPTPSSDVLRGLVAILRIVPELERSGDLVEHIALRTPQGMADQLSHRARGLIEQMGQIGVTMWQCTAEAYANGDLGVARRLRTLDDELDDLHV